MSSSWGLATVTKVEEIKTETLSGLLVYHDYEPKSRLICTKNINQKSRPVF